MLFPAQKDGVKAITYAALYKFLIKVFKNVGILTAKICHAMRHSAARILDALG
jgi:hypothetical protein